MLTLRIAQNITPNSNDLFVDVFGLFFPSFCSNSCCICFNVFQCILIAVCCYVVCVFFRIMDAGFLKAGKSKSKNLPGLLSRTCRLKKLAACRQQSWKPLVLGYIFTIPGSSCAGKKTIYIGAIELFSSITGNKQMKDLFRHIEFSLCHVAARRAIIHFSPAKLGSGVHPLACTQPYHTGTARYPH